MDTTPTDLKKQNIISFMTPKQRTAFALTSKTEMKWMRPILEFMGLPLAEKIVYIKGSSRSNLTDDIIMEVLSKQLDNVLISLLEELPESSKRLQHKIQSLLEKRLCDWNYRKLIKKTLLKNYIQHLLRQNKSVARFINSIKKPQIRSLAIEQYLLTADITPNTRKKWIEKIPDQHTRRKFV